MVRGEERRASWEWAVGLDGESVKVERPAGRDTQDLSSLAFRVRSLTQPPHTGGRGQGEETDPGDPRTGSTQSLRGRIRNLPSGAGQFEGRRDYAATGPSALTAAMPACASSKPSRLRRPSRRSKAARSIHETMRRSPGP